MQKSRRTRYVQNATRKEPIASEPDTIVITKIDTVYIEAPVVEVKEKRIEEIKPSIKTSYLSLISQRESFTDSTIINILNSRPPLKGHTVFGLMLTTSNVLKIELLPYVSFYFRMALKMIEL